MAIRWLVVLCLLLPLAKLSCATGVELQAYHNARIVYHSQADVDEYILALGSLKKTKESWVADSEVRLSGKLERITLELPDNHAADSGFSFYLEQLKAFNYRELFHCAGRDCGTSNSWANNYFKIPLLYGLDQYQQYGVYEILNVGVKPYYVVVYSVLRGNRRVFMQVEVLLSDMSAGQLVSAGPEVLYSSLLNRGYYIVPTDFEKDKQGRMQAQFSGASLAVLIELLNRNKELRLALVGHDYAPVNLLKQQENSHRYALKLKLELVKAGIADARIETFGLGGLAPAGRMSKGARIEVVKL
jgi:hypothetical protein